MRSISSSDTDESSPSEAKSDSTTTEPLSGSTATTGTSKLGTAAIVLACVCAGVVIVGGVFFKRIKERATRFAGQLTFSSHEDAFISPEHADESGVTRASGASPAPPPPPMRPDEQGILPEFDLGKDQVTPQKKMGAHGLWRAEFQDRKVVALKLNPQALHLSYKKLNVALQTYAPLKHANIVAFIGSCVTSMDDVLIVVEHLEKGSLRSVLSDAKTELSWSQRVQMGVDIASGLAFLRSLEPAAPVSYNLTTKSVLCDAKLTCKLDIFDYAERLRDSKAPVLSFGDGDIAMRAPELLAGSLVTEAAEVYALGVMLCEISLRHRVFDDILTDDGPTLGDIAIAKRVAAQEIVPTPSDDASEAYRKVVAQCVAREPADRPRAAEVAQMLTQAG